MPIEFRLWRVDEGLKQIPVSKMSQEAKLEDLLKQDIGILGLDLMMLGSQVATDFGTRIDLLSVNAAGDLFVIEVKRDRTPREVIAQLLEYGSWVSKLTYDSIIDIFTQSNPKRVFEEAFSERFGAPPPEELNRQHRLVVVASELDGTTERVMTYLSEDYGVPINTVLFGYFREGSREYLSRAWLIDPTELESRAEKSLGGAKGKEPWNKRDFYVAIGEWEGRSWDDCRKYGFVSAGHGRVYSGPLDNLFPGARVFVHIPGKGYVGVGEVVEPAKRIKDFKVKVNGKDRPILKAPLHAPKMGKYSSDPELSEYLVRVKWTKTLAKDEAFWEKGLFAKQNTVCKLRNKFTLDKLTVRFGLTE